MLLLNDILPEEIVHIEYEPNEVDMWKGDDKKVIMDVICHTKDGRRFIVEMQRGDRRNFRPRMLFYSAALLYTQLKTGDSYGKLMPGYVICFMNSLDSPASPENPLLQLKFGLIFCKICVILPASRSSTEASTIPFSSQACRLRYQ